MGSWNRYNNAITVMLPRLTGLQEKWKGKIGSAAQGSDTLKRWRICWDKKKKKDKGENKKEWKDFFLFLWEQRVKPTQPLKQKGGVF